MSSLAICPASSKSLFGHNPDCVHRNGHPHCQCQGTGLTCSGRSCPAYQCTDQNGNRYVPDGGLYHPNLLPGGVHFSQIDLMSGAVEEYLDSLKAPISGQDLHEKVQEWKMEHRPMDVAMEEIGRIRRKAQNPGMVLHPERSGGKLKQAIQRLSSEQVVELVSNMN